MHLKGAMSGTVVRLQCMAPSENLIRSGRTQPQGENLIYNLESLLVNLQLHSYTCKMNSYAQKRN